MARAARPLTRPVCAHTAFLRPHETHKTHHTAGRVQIRRPRAQIRRRRSGRSCSTAAVADRDKVAAGAAPLLERVSYHRRGAPARPALAPPARSARETSRPAHPRRARVSRASTRPRSPATPASGRDRACAPPCAPRDARMRMGVLMAIKKHPKTESSLEADPGVGRRLVRRWQQLAFLEIMHYAWESYGFE